MALYFASVDAIALTAATAKSVLEVATPSTDDCRIKEWWVEFDGVTAANTPVKVECGRFSAAVTTATTYTTTASAAALQNTNIGASAMVVKHTTTTEGAGTATAVKIHRIPPTSGYHYVAPLGQEFLVPISSFWRMRLTAAQTVNATVGVIWED